MRETLTFFEMILKYIGKDWFFLAVPVALILLFTDKKIAHRKFTGIFLIILCAIIFNPYSYKIYDKVSGQSTYYRFLWIIPGYIAVAYLVIRIIRNIKNDAIKVLISLAICTMIFIFKAPPTAWDITQNKYFIPDDVVACAEIIDSAMDDHDIKDTTVICDEHMTNYIRLYDARIKLIYHLRSFENFETFLASGNKITESFVELISNTDNISDKEIRLTLKKYKVHFVILPNDFDNSISHVEAIGYTNIASVDKYNIYFNPSI